MERKKMYIHVGCPKTGTTSLQTYLYDNRELLLNKFNVYIPNPQLYSSDSNAVHHLFEYIIHSHKLQNLLDDLIANRECNILLTDEQLTYNFILTDSIIDNFKSALPDHDIIIIVYIRRIDDWIKSLYAQAIKGRHFTIASDGFQKYIYNIQEYIPSVFRLSSVIERYRKLVGNDCCCIRLYSKDTLKNGDIIDDFLEILEVEKRLLPEPGTRKNRSLPTGALPFLELGALPEHFTVLNFQRVKWIWEFAFSDSANLRSSSELQAHFAEEIDRLDALVPGYKRLFETRTFSLGLSEKAADPIQLANAYMVYEILHEASETRKETVRLHAYLREHSVSGRWKKFKRSFRKRASWITNFLFR